MELCSLLRKLSYTWPDIAAVEDGRESVSYSALFERVDTVSHALVTLGCRRGSKLAFIGQSGLRFAELLLASSQLGAELIPLPDAGAGAPGEAGFVFIGRGTEGKPPDLIGDVKVISEENAAGTISYGKLLRRRGSFRPERAARGDDILLSFPGGGRYSSADIAQYVEACRGERPCRALLDLPPACLSFVKELCLVLVCGGTAVLTEGFRAKDWIYALADRHIDRVFLTQTMAGAVVRDAHYLHGDFSALRTIRCGLTLFEKDTLSGMRRLFPGECMIEKEYGFPKPVTRLSVTLEQAAEKTADGYVLIGSVGKPLPGLTAAAFDGDARLPSGRTGDIRVRGACGQWKSLGERGKVSREGYVFLSRDRAQADIAPDESRATTPLEELADISAASDGDELCRRAAGIVIRVLGAAAVGISACRFEVLPAVTAAAIAEQAENHAQEIPMPEGYFVAGKGFLKKEAVSLHPVCYPLRSVEGRLFGGLFVCGGDTRNVRLVQKMLTRLLEAHESLRLARLQCELFRQTAQLSSEGIGISRIEPHPSLLFVNDIASEQINNARSERAFGKKLEQVQTDNMNELSKPGCDSSSRSFYTHVGGRKIWVNYRAEKLELEGESFAVCFSNTQDNHSSTRHLENILTNREIEVVALLGRGASNKDIARALGISENTVKYHLSRIYEKMEVSGRTELLGSTYMRAAKKR